MSNSVMIFTIFAFIFFTSSYFHFLRKPIFLKKFHSYIISFALFAFICILLKVFIFIPNDSPIFKFSHLVVIISFIIALFLYVKFEPDGLSVYNLKKNFLEKSIYKILDDMQIKYHTDRSSILLSDSDAKIKIFDKYIDKLIVAITFKNIDDKLKNSIIDKLILDNVDSNNRNKDYLIYAFFNLLVGLLSMAIGFL